MENFRRLVRRLHCQAIENIFGDKAFPRLWGKVKLCQILIDALPTNGRVNLPALVLGLHEPESASNIFGVEPNRLIPVDVAAHAFNLV